MTASPGAWPVTVPLLRSTEAMEGSLEDQMMRRSSSAALAG